MTTELNLLETLCDSLTKVTADRQFRADRQSQDFRDLMQALADSKVFVANAHIIDEKAAKGTGRRKRVVKATS